MIKYFLAKTVYKDLSKEAQEMTWRLDGMRGMLIMMCTLLLWGAHYAMLCMTLYAMIFVLHYSTLSVCMAILSGVLLVCCYVYDYSCSRIVNNLWFTFYTKRGQGLSRQDFEQLRERDEKLYQTIATRKCIGYCAYVSFALCQVLEKGHIEFMAIKKVLPMEYEQDYRNFTLHVAYVYNGWAFDTYSVRQFPLDELHEIYRAKVYRSFTYEEIAGLVYEDFMDLQRPDYTAWCEKNDCTAFVRRSGKA